MHIKELNIYEFEDFVNKNPLGSHYQSLNYALLMAENGYEYDLIGYVDDYNQIYAASLILIKKINTLLKYGYAPKGFIIDYFNTALLKSFTKDLINYYYKNCYIFII